MNASEQHHLEFRFDKGYQTVVELSMIGLPYQHNYYTM